MKTILWAAVSLALVHCNTPGKTPATTGTTATTDTITTGDTTANAAMGDNSRNALDWAGTYTGALPCADCEAIATRLTLSSGNDYVLQTVYVGKSATANKSTGKFEWNAAGNTITLKGISNGPTMYKVGEGRLVQLDLEGKAITGDLASRYVLTKAATALNRYWKLMELNGKPLPASAVARREPHIIFHPFDGRVSGSGGCNNFSGTYTEEANHRLVLSPLASTKMACTDMTTEDAFLKVLGAVDNYTVTADTLQLYKAGTAALAKFVAVEMK